MICACLKHYPFFLYRGTNKIVSRNSIFNVKNENFENDIVVSSA